jgi:hypothetical protein
MAGMPFQVHPCWERVWADPDMSAILTIKGLVRGGIFSSLFVAVDKKGLAHLLGISYEALKALVCEKMYSKNIKKVTPGFSLIHRLTIPLLP